MIRLFFVYSIVAIIMRKETVGYENITGYVYDNTINFNRRHNNIIIKNIDENIKDIDTYRLIFYNINNNTIEIDKNVFQIYFINCDNITFITDNRYRRFHIDNSRNINFEKASSYNDICFTNCSNIDISKYSNFNKIEISNNCTNVYVSKKCEIAMLTLHIKIHISKIENIIKGKWLSLNKLNNINLIKYQNFDKVEIFECCKVFASYPIKIKILYVNFSRRIYLHNIEISDLRFRYKDIHYLQVYCRYDMEIMANIKRFSKYEDLIYIPSH